LKEIIITNNPLVHERFCDKFIVELYEIDYIQLLEIVRDKIHVGHKLLSHPLSGSVKPNETPYKTVIISEDKANLDMDSLILIENSINTTRRFLNDKKTPDWNERIRKDFQIVDLSLVENVINNILL